MYRILVYRIHRGFFGEKYRLVEDLITDNYFMIVAVAERYKYDPSYITTTVDESVYYQ